jgi:Stage II sporulation protein E (SpoIIE)
LYAEDARDSALAQEATDRGEAGVARRSFLCTPVPISRDLIGQHGTRRSPSATTDAAYTTGHMDLRLGDCILLFTDGVTDTQDLRGSFVDLEGIKTWVASHGDNPAPHVASAMVQWLRGWRGAAMFDDDLTLVVARFAG